ncbi:hypothetical protein WICPIJ_006147 [Wickerhamomyces pijperi]|uniref:Uncharacterized protein n=1 Tax=Wickerhamomyces pijperi TaxID=599730 RepID=A0A9P8TL56_WICPI|nr:hypothetical protein WICPIJ_006147 [Wickerhamomyces pijperi]
MSSSTSFQEWPIEEITVESGNNRRLGVMDVFKESLNQGLFIVFVENGKQTWIFRLWGVLEVFNVFADDLSVGDKEPVTVNHLGSIGSTTSRSSRRRSDIVPFPNSQITIDGNPRCIRHIMFSQILNVILDVTMDDAFVLGISNAVHHQIVVQVDAHLQIPWTYTSATTVDSFLLIFLDDDHQELLSLKQICHVRESELQQGSLDTNKMVRYAQILLS